MALYVKLLAKKAHCARPPTYRVGSSIRAESQIKGQTLQAGNAAAVSTASASASASVSAAASAFFCLCGVLVSAFKVPTSIMPDTLSLTAASTVHTAVQALAQSQTQSQSQAHSDWTPQCTRSRHPAPCPQFIQSEDALISCGEHSTFHCRFASPRSNLPQQRPIPDSRSPHPRCRSFLLLVVAKCHTSCDSTQLNGNSHSNLSKTIG